ncbi:MAG TPA: NINE protein [Candidatus Sericytochromatia bacterium]
MLNKPKNRTIATLLAFSGIVIPLAGLHKFYLGQPRWGLLYLVLSWTPIPHVASAIEGVWYLAQNTDKFDDNFNTGIMSVASTPTNVSTGVDPTQVSAIAEALRQLDQLRQDGLISEYEFEQKRRQWLDRMA